eukprot:1189384-Prorocentrum_minimum.AAC.4
MPGLPSDGLLSLCLDASWPPLVAPSYSDLGMPSLMAPMGTLRCAVCGARRQRAASLADVRVRARSSTDRWIGKGVVGVAPARDTNRLRPSCWYAYLNNWRVILAVSIPPFQLVFHHSSLGPACILPLQLVFHHFSLCSTIPACILPFQLVFRYYSSLYVCVCLYVCARVSLLSRAAVDLWITTRKCVVDKHDA